MALIDAMILLKDVLRARATGTRMRVSALPGRGGLDGWEPWRDDEQTTPSLLSLRLELLDVDPMALKRVQPAEFKRLAHVCGYCQYKYRCEADLAREFAGLSPAGNWTDYCPNAFRMPHGDARIARASAA
jgi:hypothetical protein